jgi:hypothetical protein
MFVQRQSDSYAQPFHHSEGNGISEGKILVSVAENDFASTALIFLCGADDMNSVPDTFKPLGCNVPTQSCQDKGMGFSDDEGRRYQNPTTPVGAFQNLADNRMVAVSPIDGSVEETTVAESASS